MADVFISYSREDREPVRAIVAILEEAGFSVWWDRALEPGTKWADVIDRELRRACCVLVVWSRHSLASRWVGIEANEARRRDILIPLALEPVALGDEFAGIHRLNWFDSPPDAAGRTLVARVRALVRRSKRKTFGPRIALPGVLGLAVVLVVVWLAKLGPTAPTERPASAPATSAPPPRSIAVLPFRHDGEAEEGLASGIAVELIDALSQINGLRVSARVAAWALPEDLPIEQIRRRLHVAWLVDGDVTPVGDQVRVRVRLVDSATGVLKRTFDELATEKNLQNVPMDLAGRLVGALPDLGLAVPDESTDPGIDGDAYRLYLLGQALLHDERSVGSRVRAESYFERALDIAPGYSDAMAGECEARLWRYDQSNHAADLRRAGEFCAQAFTAAPDATRVLLAVGRLVSVRGDDWPRAEKIFETVLAREPFDADARVGLAQARAAAGDPADAEVQFRHAIADQPGYWRPHNALANFLFQQGRAEEAVPEYVAALDYAPQEPTALSNLGAALLLADQLPAAISAFQRSLAAGETPSARSNLGTAYYYAQRFEDAASTFERATALTPTDYRLWGNLGDAWSIVGDPRASEAYQRAETLARANLAGSGDAVETRVAIEAYRAARGKSSLGALSAVLDGHLPNWQTEYFAAVALRRLGAGHRAAERLKAAIDLGFPRTMATRDPLVADLLQAPVTSKEKGDER